MSAKNSKKSHDKKLSRKVGGFISIVTFLIGLGLGIGIQVEIPISRELVSRDLPPSPEISSSFLINTNDANIEICFTPPTGCSTVIASAIDRAKNTIYLQAYGLTSKQIIAALIRASNREVKIQTILDRSNFSEKKRIVQELQNAGIEVIRDNVSGIAHNKVMIIDERKVITGSFNFTESANLRNAENVIIIDDPKVAQEYLTNWQNRKDSSLRIDHSRSHSKK